MRRPHLKTPHNRFSQIPLPFIGQLSQELYEKGVDGFFIDNCDVYYYAPRESIFEGLNI